MADDDPDDDNQEILPPEKESSDSQELASIEFRELMAVERQRLDASNKRTEVVRLMVEANDSADKRQFDYQMAKLTSKENEFKTTHGLLKLIVLVGGASVIAVVAFLFYMAFLGTPAQSQISLKILGSKPNKVVDIFCI